MSHNTNQPQDPSPFHPGEQHVQELLGVRDIEHWARKVVRDHLPEQHREFHTAQPFLIVAARDKAGRPWVTLLDGPDGFVTSPDPNHLVIGSKPGPGDALEHAFVAGQDMGILGIELATRRRNRVNGRVAVSDGESITFSVVQAYGNCPQYIRERAWRRVEDQPGMPATRGSSLTPQQRKWIECADTFFVASGYRGDGDKPAYGMDASHRGGDTGFVNVLNARKLRFPDYAGNNHYNTIGNLVLDPRAGFLFVDFETGSLLQLTGTASIDWNSDAVDSIPGAQRLVTLEIDEVVELPSAVGLRWQSDADSVRSLRLLEKLKESADVTSFVFGARDGGPLPPFEAGQHLPIELDVPGMTEPVRRTYSLSGSPFDDRYRITVKREPKGLASTHLHDDVEVGSIIECRRPAGEFMMTCEICPLVFVSAGVGVTPMVSMLHAVASAKSDRPVWFIHGARDGKHHALAEEVKALTAAHSNIRPHIAYSRPGPEDIIGRDFDTRGRITGELLARLATGRDAHYFLCGPTQFMAQIQSDLEALDIPAGNVHTETFGPIG